MDDWLYGQVQSSLIAQNTPAVSTPVTAFVATLRTEITHYRVVNISGATRTFRLSHQTTGAFNTSAVLEFDRTVSAGVPYIWGNTGPESGISIAEDETVMIRSDLTSGLVFSFYGRTQGRGR